MKAPATLALLLAVMLGLGCSGGAAPQPEAAPQPKPRPEAKVEPRPEARPAPRTEPEHITVAHILISFAGTKTEATRSRAEAEKLASDILARAQKGEDFDRLMRTFSDDPGSGVYMMANRGIKKAHPDEFSRNDMVAAFGDVGFTLDVDAIDMSVYDAKKSPFGWHIIKRVK
ncbi:MAG TPA: peptidylprolyl isomerase [Planctomycetota bacterium]|nr:peptidylprolyl isomerase [Planctomycetota bacterium]